MNLSHLNPAQRQAVTQTEGPVLVLAGAGTGKTTVITWRIAHLLERGTAAENVLAVTFTNKAAREMADRLADLLPAAVSEALTVSTFHSFCCRVIRQHAELLGYDRNFGIADDTDQEGLVRQIMGDLRLDRQQEMDAAYFRRGIGRAKMHLRTPADVQADQAGPLGDVYQRYQQALRNMNLMDFDDLLALTVRLWREQSLVLNRCRQRYHYILVDEYQDTNAVQAELVRMLAGETCNVCVVGDDDQSIYGWRGANPENILRFAEMYPGACIVKLEENYRSTGAILNAANALIAHNCTRHGKRLWSRRDTGSGIRLIEAADETAEGGLVARLVKQFKADTGVDYRDMAVLCRSNYQTRAFEQALRELAVPHRVVGARSFYERREIRDAIAYLRLLHNPSDDLALLRVINCPPRGFGDAAAARLRERRAATSKPMVEVVGEATFQAGLSASCQLAVEAFVYAWKEARQAVSEAGNLAEKLRHYLRNTGYLDGLGRIYRKRDDALTRHENVVEFLSAAAVFEERTPGPVTLELFLEKNALLDNSDRVEEREEDGDNAVSLMTVHAAKGLEFEVVILVGVEQNLFPHERALRDYTTDEERRLFYVAVTRARSELVMTRARSRTRFGARKAMRASQFIHEIPAEMIAVINAKDAFAAADRDSIDQAVAEMLAHFN